MLLNLFLMVVAVGLMFGGFVSSASAVHPAAANRATVNPTVAQQMMLMRAAAKRHHKHHHHHKTTGATNVAPVVN